MLFDIWHWSCRFGVVAFGAALALAAGAWLPATASASHSQIAIIQDVHDAGPLNDSQQALRQFRELGANTVRVIIPWATVAPDPTSIRKPPFDASDPNAYPASGWAAYDAVVQTAQQDGLTVDLTVTGGAPRWAEGRDVPRAGRSLGAWKPSARAYGQFARAVGTRYDGHFTPNQGSSPLPAVKFWSIFEEPNFGEHLAPQAVDGSRVSVAPNDVSPPRQRRVQRAEGHRARARHDPDWRARRSRDQRQAVQAAASGLSRQLWADQAVAVHPHALLRQLRLSAAARRGRQARGCPTNAAGSRKFRRRNPGLFTAGGVGDHPEPGNRSPVTDGTSDPDFATIANLGRLENTLDRVNMAYGSSKTYAIYNDEYGYITHPPAGSRYVSPATAAHYNNWAEFLSWKNPRVASYMQYLLDPGATSFFSGFDNGLEAASGQPKPSYSAYVLPLYLPQTSFSSNANVEVWGGVRPAPFMQHDGNGPQTAAVQLNDKTVSTVTAISSSGYFDLHMKFATSGNLRLAYTYPSSDPFLPVGAAGSTFYSRSITIKVH